MENLFPHTLLPSLLLLRILTLRILGTWDQWKSLEQGWLSWGEEDQVREHLNRSDTHKSWQNAFVSADGVGSVTVRLFSIIFIKFQTAELQGIGINIRSPAGNEYVAKQSIMEPVTINIFINETEQTLRTFANIAKLDIVASPSAAWDTTQRDLCELEKQNNVNTMKFNYGKWTSRAISSCTNTSCRTNSLKIVLQKRTRRAWWTWIMDCEPPMHTLQLKRPTASCAALSRVLKGSWEKWLSTSDGIPGVLYSVLSFPVQECKRQIALIAEKGTLRWLTEWLSCPSY